MILPNDKKENKQIFHLSLPIRAEYDECLKKIHPIRRPPDDELFKKIIIETKNIIKPQSIYRFACIESKESWGVMIDGTKFTGPLLSGKLFNRGTVFPYIISLGEEIENKLSAADNLIEQFYLDQISNLLLRKCATYLESHIKRSHNIKQLSCISPGSLTDWPIEDQKPLFSLFGDTQSLIGVSLTPQMLMVPRKSVSGIYFPSKEKFIACSLCSRNDCPERTVPYKG